MRAEWIGTGQAVLANGECDPGDHGCIRQDGGIEGQDGAVLAICSIIPKIEEHRGGVHSPAHTRILAGFEHPAIQGPDRTQDNGRAVAIGP